MILGVTGHQRLSDPAQWDWVATALETEIAQGSPNLTGLTSLALGADQLFARIVLRQGGRLLHIKPFADYERTFAREALAAYQELAGRAETVVLAVPGSDQDAYLEAGHCMVDRAERLLAVWDGQPARGKGGTADIVQYARDRKIEVRHVDPTQKRVRTID